MFNLFLCGFWRSGTLCDLVPTEHDLPSSAYSLHIHLHTIQSIPMSMKAARSLYINFSQQLKWSLWQQLFSVCVLVSVSRRIPDNTGDTRKASSALLLICWQVAPGVQGGGLSAWMNTWMKAENSTLCSSLHLYVSQRWTEGRAYLFILALLCSGQHVGRLFNLLW